MRIILGPASRRLGRRVAELLGAPIVDVDNKIFPDGESYIRFKGSVGDDNVVIVQSTYPPQDRHLIELFLMLDAVKDEGVQNVTAVVPYLAYARQDKRFLEGEALSAKTITGLIETLGATRFLTIDVHQASILRYFHIPATNLSAMPAIAEHFEELALERPFVLAPDKGALSKARAVSERLRTDCGFFEKHRDRSTGEVTTVEKRLDIQGRDVIIVDDIISTGSSVANVADVARRQGAHSIFAACTHPLLQESTLQKLSKAGVELVIGTDCVESSISDISVASLIADAVRK